MTARLTSVGRAFHRYLNVMKIQKDSLCPVCGEKEETSFHLLGGNAVLIMYVWIRYSTFGAYLMQPEVLHKVDDVLFCGLQEPQRFS